MLEEAIASLNANAANAGEEIQIATFSEGKYRAILHAPTETLRIVDETLERGTLYKSQKGRLAQTCEFTEAERESFTGERERQYRHQKEGCSRGWQQE